MGFLVKTKGFLVNPVATFKAVRNGTLKSALIYAFIWFVILGAFFGFISSMFSGMVNLMFIFTPGCLEDLAFSAIPITAISVGILGVIGILIGGLWQQLWVKILGGKKGYIQTAKALSYGATPSILIGWIPYIGGVVGSIWAIVVIIIGLRELHAMSTVRAISAWLLCAVSLYFIIWAFIVILIIIGYLVSGAWI